MKMENIPKMYVSTYKKACKKYIIKVVLIKTEL